MAFAGEVQEKIKKIFRDKNGVFSEEDKQALAKELGLSLDEVAQANIQKLAARRNTGMLQGDGDTREEGYCPAYAGGKIA